MTPENGQGCSMAAEDSVCLAQCLSEEKNDIDAALSKYESIRKPRTTHVAKKARFNGTLLSFQNWYLCWLRSMVFGNFGETIMSMQTDIWGYKVC